MTLEEFINHNKGVIKHLTCGDEVLDYLEELKLTRKALEMACKEICYSEENFDNGYLTKDYVELFLQKARKE